MLYPLKFEPVYKQIIWGGNAIRNYFNRVVPFDKVAES
jgi:mannose-6-phosphate isomerase